LVLSSIYDWYAADSAAPGGVVAHLLRHADDALAAAIRDMPAIAGYRCDWALNAA
jgi:hypothetical protein